MAFRWLGEPTEAAAERPRGRSSESTGMTDGRSLAEGKSWASGWSEALVPIMKVRPTAVHSLQNVTHMAAEMLCSLPTGVAVVRTIQNGSIEGAIIRVPYRECLPVSDEQYAADLADGHGAQHRQADARRDAGH